MTLTKLAMYKIRGADEKEYGPVSAEVVQQWIAERRANAQTAIQAEGSPERQPLSAFPEFSEALRAASAPPIGGGAPPVPRIPGPIGNVGAAAATTSGMAIASLVLGILGFFSCGITGLVGLILGVLSLSSIRKSEG